MTENNNNDADGIIIEDTATVVAFGADAVRAAIAASMPKPKPGVAMLPSDTVALPNNSTTGSPLAPVPHGALIATHGVQLQAMGVNYGSGEGSYTTTRSASAQWPNLGAPSAMVIAPCRSGSGSACLITGRQIERSVDKATGIVEPAYMHGTKLWPYSPGQIQVAVSASVLGMLADVAMEDDADPTLVALVAMLVAIPETFGEGA
jgi:hypothetical protein